MDEKLESLKETDLYDAVSGFLRRLGYEVQAEVDHCDVAARKEDHIILIEMKLNLSVRLLTQAVLRQRTGADVYIAVPKPKNFKGPDRDLLHLLRRLELGLLYVSPKTVTVECALHPQPFDREQSIRRNRKKRAHLAQELDARNCSINRGGSAGIKLMTAYREQAVFLCCILYRNGELPPKELAHLTALEYKKVYSILTKNYYGWFERAGQGLYRLTSVGESALENYREVADYYFAKLDGEQME